MDIPDEIERKYNLPTYKAIRLIKQATKIVDNLLSSSTSFTDPYGEAKTVLEIAQMLIDKTGNIREDITEV